MNWLRVFRQSDNSIRRLRAGRRPLVESLEGRQLLSGIQGNHIGVMSPMAIQGNHIGYSTAAVAPSNGAHIDIIAILAVPSPLKR